MRKAANEERKKKKVKKKTNKLLIEKYSSAGKRGPLKGDSERKII